MFRSCRLPLMSPSAWAKYSNSLIFVLLSLFLTIHSAHAQGSYWVQPCDANGNLLSNRA